MHDANTTNQTKTRLYDFTDYETNFNSIVLRFIIDWARRLIFKHSSLVIPTGQRVHKVDRQ